MLTISGCSIALQILCFSFSELLYAIIPKSFEHSYCLADAGHRKLNGACSAVYAVEFRPSEMSLVE